MSTPINIVPQIEAPLVQPEKPSVSSHGNETILLVEDEPAVRALVARVLKQQGYEVLEAPDGLAALALISERADFGIDIIISDVVMPHMNGKVLLERIHGQYPATKALLISGYTDDVIITHSRTAPHINFLPKPFSPSVLVRTVREILDEGQPTAR